MLLGREYSNIKQGRVTQPHAIWHTHMTQTYMTHITQTHTQPDSWPRQWSVYTGQSTWTLDSEILYQRLWNQPPLSNSCQNLHISLQWFQTVYKHFSPRYIHDTQAKTCLAQHYANVVLRASKQTSVSWRYKMGAGLVQNGRGWSVTSQFKICQDFRLEWIPNWWRRLWLSGKSLTTTASNCQLRGKTPSIEEKVERWKLFLAASSSILPSLVDRGEHFIISINPANCYY